ncbi:TraB/GumN family protein [Empedobacter tilapiae]|uniref:TraB/GumN family protein n=1 Tax=Empedobacter tilapiae TaxID=2491114 RepID=UPI0028D6FA48|nr:TraB/GumN family protein [Empedobacter tilapiae]
MRKIITFVCLFIFSFTFAQNSLLWKIESKDLQQPSYLFGTVHMICKDKFAMQPKLVKTIERTSQAVFEIDMGNPNFMSQMQANMMSDKTISSQISKEDSIYLDNQLKTKFGTNLAAFDQIKPMLIMAMLMQSSFPCQVTSFEEEIIASYKEANKPMAGLSTVKDQYDYLDRFIDSQEMVKALKEMDSEKTKEIFDTMFTAYKNENINQLDKIMKEYSASNPELYDVLMVERNEKWIELIPEIIKSKSTLIAVGSAHLAGEKGLINLLKSKGYKVTAILD